MLVIYDSTGFIQQTINVGDFDALRTVYQANGLTTLDVDSIGDPSALYVKDDRVLPRPVVSVIPSGPNQFAVSPPSYSLTVKVGDVTVYTGSDTTGSLDLSGSQSGAYTLRFDAAFPYLPTIVEVTL